jgi:N-acetylglucosamine-6-phosphate deacetylase
VSDRFLVIDAGTILSPTDKFSPGRVVIRSGIVERVGLSSDVFIPQGAERIHATAFTLVPGFIDTHIHGCAGVDVMDASFDSMNDISKALATHGTTSFLPTTVSEAPQILGDALERLGVLLDETYDGAMPLGIHLEGPFINVDKRGTHRSDNIVEPKASLLENWTARARGKVKLITIAPELDEGLKVANAARSSGIAVAMGHSNASFEQAASASNAGIHYAVHTFNAMRDFRHRDSGIIGAVLTDDRIFAEIISDGIHVSPEVVKIFARSKGRDRILLVTDAISATGMPDGPHVLGTETIQVKNGICRNAEGRLAGSTLTQDAALRNFVSFSGMRMEDAVFGLTLNPALALNIEGRGRIEPGSHADLTLLDDGLRVMRTFARGKLVFERR